MFKQMKTKSAMREFKARVENGNGPTVSEGLLVSIFTPDKIDNIVKVNSRTQFFADLTNRGFTYVQRAVDRKEAQAIVDAHKEYGIDAFYMLREEYNQGSDVPVAIYARVNEPGAHAV